MGKSVYLTFVLFAEPVRQFAGLHLRARVERTLRKRTAKVFGELFVQRGHVAINWQLNSNWPQLLLLLFSDGLLFRLLLLLFLLLFAAFGNCFWHVYHLGLLFDWALAAANIYLFIMCSWAILSMSLSDCLSVRLAAYEIYFCSTTVWGHAWTGAAVAKQ